jgi:hypothetical protein
MGAAQRSYTAHQQRPEEHAGFHARPPQVCSSCLVCDNTLGPCQLGSRSLHSVCVSFEFRQCLPLALHGSGCCPSAHTTGFGADQLRLWVDSSRCSLITCNYSQCHTCHMLPATPHRLQCLVSLMFHIDAHLSMPSLDTMGTVMPAAGTTSTGAATAAVSSAWRSCCCLAPSAQGCGTRAQTWTSPSLAGGATGMDSCWTW